MSETITARLGFFGRISLFFRQVISELRKVVWPTREQLATYTVVVMVFVTILAIVVSVFDLGFTKIVLQIFG
jgi:preprotein translocase subunit SecE